MHHITIDLKIAFDSKWHCGSGEGGLLTDRLISRDSRDRPYIPGSTLKGVVRESCEKLSRSLGFPDPCDPHKEDLVVNPGIFLPLSEARSPVDRVFGNKYEEGRLINVGANRWAARLKLGSIFPLHPKWLLEAEASAWFFGDDDDFVAGKREQDPIYAVEVHLVRRFSPGFWASLEANYFTGGRQIIGGEKLVDLQSNRRIGTTLVVPFRGRNAVKLGFSTGTRTRYGNDFRQLLVTYQRIFD